MYGRQRAVKSVEPTRRQKVISKGAVRWPGCGNHFAPYISL
jgi:hypothetical protein